MAWQITFDPKAKKDLDALDNKVKAQILSYLFKRVGILEDPRMLGEPLTGSLSGAWRYRVDKYRILCVFQNDELVVIVMKVGKRDSVYKKQTIH